MELAVSTSKDGWNAMKGQPRTCRCGAVIRLTKDTAWFRTGPAAQETFCSACTPKYRLVRA
jgi:hypothetical protein